MWSGVTSSTSRPHLRAKLPLYRALDAGAKLGYFFLSEGFVWEAECYGEGEASLAFADG